MMKNWIAMAGGAALILGVAGSASAQSNGAAGFSPRIGVFLPTEASAGSSWFGAGFDYKLAALPGHIPGTGTYGYFGLSLDYYTYSGNSNLPVVINYNLRQDHLVFSLGAGIEFYDVPDFSSSSGTGFDAQAGVTYDFGNPGPPIFLQAKYYFASQSELRGFGVYAGVRL
jgi:hypothetical protein